MFRCEFWVFHIIVMIWLRYFSDGDIKWYIILRIFIRKDWEMSRKDFLKIYQSVVSKE